MRDVLLVTSPVATPPRAIDRAFRHAKELGGALLALVVLDPALPRRVGTTLTNIGFVGEELSEHVVDTLAREHRELAEALLKQVGEQAKREGVAVTPLIEVGDPRTVCARILRERDVQCVVVVVGKRSWLARSPWGAAAAQLAASAGCEVITVEDELL